MAYNRNKGISFVEGLEAMGTRAFTVDEACQRMVANRKNTLAILGRLVITKRIIPLSRGLYALWHPSERKWGIHPLPILDTLMRHLKSPYYVGLLSAADNFGATHQKPQMLQVIVPKQMNLRRAKKLAISFHVQRSFPSAGITFIKTPSGKAACSSPELTALDILYFESACGGFHNTCSVINGLIPKLNKADLQRVICSYPHPSSVQRLGYLLEHFKADGRLQNVLKRWAKGKKIFPIALTSSYPKKGRVHELWRIVENTNVEAEQ